MIDSEGHIVGPWWVPWKHSGKHGYFELSRQGNSPACSTFPEQKVTKFSASAEDWMLKLKLQEFWSLGQVAEKPVTNHSELRG
jgi:hypothetical protein